MESVLAEASNYFDVHGLPLAVLVSQSHPSPDQPDFPLSHPHDLTEVNHHHDFSELVIVSKGAGIQCLEGMDLPISAGDVFLLQGEQSHYFHHREELELVNIMFDPDSIDIPENELRRIPGYSSIFLLEPRHRKKHRFASRLHLSREKLTDVEYLTERIIQEHEEKNPGFEVMMRAKFMELITYLSRSYDGVQSTASRSLLKVSHVIGAIEEDYCRSWKLDDFVALSGMSKSSLLGTFKKATGLSPLAYLLSVRIQKASKLLRNSDYNITEIAFAVGFNDSNYFTRQFRKTIGLSPKQYREVSRK